VEGTSKKEKTIMLGGCLIEIIDPIHKKDFVFQIVTPDNDTFIFSTSNQETLNNWFENLNVEKDKPPVVSETTRKKQGKLLRVTKSVGGKVATSSAGKKIIRDMIGKDGVKLITIIKKVIEDLFDKSKSKEIENDIIRIGVKVILLYRNESITDNDFSQLRPRVQRLWHITQDYANIINFDYNAEAIQECANNFFTELIQILNGQISEKNIQKVRDVQQTVFATDVLNYLFREEVNQPRRKLLAQILEKYYNFN